MRPQQKIRREIVLNEIENEHIKFEGHLTDEIVGDLFDQCDEAINEFREGQVETNITPDWSRHYESKSVATKLRDGSWVGWTYWYGGGKHGNPEEIPWMGDAYELDVVEEQKMVTVYNFTRK